MDIRKLQYFISVAETLNFTKAAQESFISQAAISQHIANMENELGFLLFNRSKQKVELTEAGKEFLDDIKVIVQKYDRAVRKAQIISNKSGGELKIVYSEPMDMAFLLMVMAEFMENHIGADITLEKQSFKRVSYLLENGLCDIVFSFPYDLGKLNDIEQVYICTKNMYLAVSKKHARALDLEIDAQEIIQEKIIMVSEEMGQGNYEHMLECCHADGYEPNIIEKVKDLGTYILMIETNKGVGFVSDLNTEITSKNISLLRINNSHHNYELVAAWKKDKKYKLKSEFISAIKKSLRNYKPSDNLLFLTHQ